jgi:TRAP-type C4-dicarboxylate transport system permease small subunit
VARTAALSKTIRYLENSAMVVVCFCAIAVMLIVSADAVLRYSMRMPLPWAADLVTNYLMVIIVYFAVSSTYQRSDHINIDLFVRMFPRRVRIAGDLVCTLVAIALFALLTWTSGQNTVSAYSHGEFLPGIIRWPVWLSFLPVAFGCALLTLRLLHHAAMVLLHGEDSHLTAERQLTE